MFRFSARPLPRALVGALLAIMTAAAPRLVGATDISDAPLSSSTSSQVKPNILFVLDDSGSMAWKYMPDGLNANTIGYRNNSCNYIYYSPTVRYEVPKAADGTDVNNGAQTAFTSAYTKGYYSYTSASATKIDLSKSFTADDNETDRAAYYWQLNPALTNTPLTPRSGICNLSTGSINASTTGVCCDTSNDYNGNCSNPTYPTSTPASCAAGKTLVWVKTLVGSNSGPGTVDIDGNGSINASDKDERQNFANWYSYYRTRIDMMKSSSGRALFPLTDKYRVGFMTIHPGTFGSSGAASGSDVSSAKFLGVKDFDANQRKDWFTKLYSQTTGSATPLRTALSVAGRYYAGKNDSINQGMVPARADDPVQYSCQQNFTILTTDGYWNDGDSRALNGSSTIANQDGNIAEVDAYNPTEKKFQVSARPMYDGSTATYVWNTAKKEYRLTSSGCSRSRQKLESRYVTTSTTYPGPGQSGSVIGSSTQTATSWSAETGCVSPAPTVPATTGITGGGPPTPPSNCTSGVQEWPCETSASAGGSENTLADTAQYYYKTDLRTAALGNCTGALGVGVCENNVPSTGTDNEDDKASWQHMTTFTMGLGLSGSLPFSATYRADETGTFADIRKGSINWPQPRMSGDDPTNLDDLWHAAVNGRGQYFSARDPDTVIDSLSKALAGITARLASAAAAATSNLEPVEGDNFAYVAKYVTQSWTGEIEALAIDLGSGAIGGPVIWSAATKLATQIRSDCDNRKIMLFRSGATNNLVDFKWNTDSCDSSGLPTGSAVTTLNAAEQGNFGLNQVKLLSQYPDMTDGSGTPATKDQRTAAVGANLVNYLRGQSGNEGFEANNLNKLYRARAGRLGDIVNAQPVFVRAPGAQYTDPGYMTYKASQANRNPMLYVAANDGMLHAFRTGTSALDAQGGTEAWAFIPSMVLSNLHKLASETYAANHVFSVDGTPTSTDIFDESASADCAQTTPGSPESCWKTILVGGLNKGGMGYYALDVTDPESPKALWEFKKGSSCISVDATSKVPTSAAYSDCHLGYSFGKPVIGKLADGTWAVFVTSGYNNDDGQGYLYVLKAMTGEVLYRIGTGSGSVASPSGLNQISAWIDNASLNRLVSRIYGVDLDGNIWRFDVNNTIAPAGREATLVAQVVDSSGTPQPITTKPELGEISGAPFVFVGTGRYLGTTDVSDSSPQTLWGIKDTMGTTAVSDIRSTLGARTITNVGEGLSAYRTIASSSSQDCSTTGEGWYVDLPDSRERININMKLFQGTLIAASNVPVQNACNVGGYAWFNYFNYRTGCAVANSPNQRVGSMLVGPSGTQSLAVGINVITLPNGKTVVIATTSAAEQLTLEPSFDYPAPLGKRVGWREILQ